MWGIVHHIVQALIPMLLVLFWNRELFQDWGFQWGNRGAGFQWVLGFSVFWLLVYAGITVYNANSGSIPNAYYDVTNARNLWGELFFRGLVVGSSEEILFRSFPIAILLRAGFTRPNRIFGYDLSSAGFFSAICFALAHIGFNIYPFEVYQFSPVQLITSLGFGLLYAIVLQHTRSIYYPMLIHSISDVVPVLSMWILKVCL